MKCRNCSQEIEFKQTYFKLAGQDHIRWHHVCYMYLKPMQIRDQAGHPFPSVTMHNDKEDGVVPMKTYRCTWDGGYRLISVEINAPDEETAREHFHARYEFYPHETTEIEE